MRFKWRAGIGCWEIEKKVRQTLYQGAQIESKDEWFTRCTGEEVNPAELVSLCSSSYRSIHSLLIALASDFLTEFGSTRLGVSSGGRSFKKKKRRNSSCVGRDMGTCLGSKFDFTTGRYEFRLILNVALYSKSSLGMTTAIASWVWWLVVGRRCFQFWVDLT